MVALPMEAIALWTGSTTCGIVCAPYRPLVG